jgi:DNA-directed RNA polymerase specialized sigma24 family protein
MSGFHSPHLYRTQVHGFLQGFSVMGTAHPCPASYGLVSPSAAAGPEQELERREGVCELLAMVSPEDARLLSMELIEGWDANALGSLMGVTPGAARVRVHRTLSRLREAWRISEQSEYYG